MPPTLTLVGSGEGDRWDDAARSSFAADAGLALAGTLNLRRTLGRVVALAVPALADWAALVLTEVSGARRVVSSGAGKRPDDRLVPAGTSAPPPAPGKHVVDHEEQLTALAAPAELARDLLTDGPATVLVLPVHSASGVDGWLSLVRRDDFDDTDLIVAGDLAQRAALAVASARIFEERATLARTLRSSLLPPSPPVVPGVEVGTRYRAAQEATEIGGDFFDLFRSHGGWDFVIGDVCGKGVEAAVLTGQARQSLRTACLVEDSPARTLRLLNEVMIQTDGTQFLTLVYGHLVATDAGLRVTLANGGHPAPLVLRQDGTVEAVSARGMLVGMIPEATFTETTVQLAPGETLLVHTDGVTEARYGTEQLGVERLIKLYADCRGMPAQAIAERVEQLVLDWLQGGAHDDIAVLALRAGER